MLLFREPIRNRSFPVLSRKAASSFTSWCLSIRRFVQISFCVRWFHHSDIEKLSFRIYISSLRCLYRIHQLWGSSEAYPRTDCWHVPFENVCNCEEQRQYYSQHETVIPSTSKNGAAGRPRLAFTKDQIEGLQEIGFSWSKISSMLGVSCSTLLCRRDEFQIGKYTELIGKQFWLKHPELESV